MPTQNVFVVKASGVREPFSEEKVLHALRASGLSPNLQTAVLLRIKKHLHNGITTQEIHRSIETYLKQEEPFAVGKFNLKRAIMELGPTGFPFERFVARLMEQYGYTTQADVVLRGACVNHEVDVYAKKDVREYFVECKYHNGVGITTDVKTVLYVKARGDDLREYLRVKQEQRTYEPWIFTNTKFSSDAIAYAACQHIRLTGWGFPQEHNLNIMIEEKKLYPITVLTSLNPQQRKTLLDQGCVLLRDMTEKGSACEDLSLSSEERARLMSEVAYLQ